MCPRLAGVVWGKLLERHWADAQSWSLYLHLRGTVRYPLRAGIEIEEEASA